MLEKVDDSFLTSSLQYVENAVNRLNPLSLVFVPLKVTIPLQDTFEAGPSNFCSKLPILP